jgi:hypothetical protein
MSRRKLHAKNHNEVVTMNTNFVCASVLVKSGLENRDYGSRGPSALTMRHPSFRKSWH